MRAGVDSAHSAMDRPVSRRRQPWRYQAYRPVIVLLVLAVLGAAAHAWWSGPEPEFHAVRRGDLPVEVMGYGHLISLGQRAVTAQESGVVEEWLVQVGDVVDEGAPVVRMVNPDLRIERDRQVTEVRRSELEQAEKRGQIAVEIEQARQRSEEAMVRVRVAQAELDANRRLHEQGVISALQLTRIEADLEFARTRAQAERRMLAILEGQGRARNQSAELSLSLAKSRLAELDERIARLTVRAPIHGAIKRIDATVGTRAEAGAVLWLIGPERPDGARIRFAQRDVRDLTAGMEARLRATDLEIEAKVARIAPDVNNGEVVVEFSLQTDAPELRVDTPVQARVRLAALTDVLYLQSPYSPRKDGSLSVWRERAGQREQVELTSVRTLGGHLVFDRQVEAGDRIAIDATALLEESQ